MKWHPHPQTKRPKTSVTRIEAARNRKPALRWPSFSVYMASDGSIGETVRPAISHCAMWASINTCTRISDRARRRDIRDRRTLGAADGITVIPVARVMLGFGAGGGVGEPKLSGNAEVSPQNEDTPFKPRSPYAAAKLYAYWITVNYREAYGFHASNGILFNHEGPTRGETFVTRKISRGVAAIELGLGDTIYLGNLDAERDWGHARDYVDGMWLMLQQPEPDDYVLATGESHSVREFVELAFAEVGRSLEWRGEGLDEKGIEVATGRVLVEVDPRYFRPTELHSLRGDASKARRKLGWKPRIGFSELVREMVASDLEEAKRRRAGEPREAAES
ncbi:MAG: GDP-mannose 4,6-dehydratase [Planctomycetes bacterium]|nr:GDP-mannose 4,6-dehydratase [Planctomycetota bacterium]